MQRLRKSAVVLLLISLLALVGLGAPPKGEEGKDESQTVYVTKTGKKYHRGGCQYLRKSQIPKTLDDAVAAGYTACSRCRPPSSSSAKSSTAKRSGSTSRSSSRSPTVSQRCAATTKKGTRCKRKASAGGKYCWQHG